MPVWADGEDNARRLTERGAAVRVYKGDDGDSLYRAIVEARYKLRYRLTHCLENLVDMTLDVKCSTILLGQKVPTDVAHQPGKLHKS